jgi:outer membrane beta-barrel protein
MGVIAAFLGVVMLAEPAQPCHSAPAPADSVALDSLRSTGASDSMAAPEAAAASVDSAFAPAGATAPPAVDSLKSTAQSPNPRLPRTRKVRLGGGSHNVVRSGPGDRFAIAGVFSKGQVFPVIAKSADWYNVELSETESGWIHASLCEEFEDLSDLEFKPNPKLYSRTGSFVLGAYSGAYAYDRKSNSLVIGGRLGYYILDRLQAEGGVGWTHVTRPREIVEELFGLSLEAEDFHMVFYHLDLTLELLPGRQMVPFVSGGVGSSIMQGDTEVSFNLGAGTMVYISKRMATRWEVRTHRFDSGSEGARVSNNNIEFTLGTSLLF